MTKEVKVTVVPYEEFADYEFEPPATFFFKNALGEVIFLHSSKREVCQAWVDEHYGEGKYKVIAAKVQRTKSKLESGELSCYGTQTRRGRNRQ